MEKKLVVGIGDMKLGRQEGTIITYALGSCVGIASTYIIIFIIFGAFLNEFGAGDYFNFYLINLIITNLFIISTLFFILYKKIKYKWIWMLLILVANITIQVNYINGHWNVDIGGLPFYLKHYAYYPFTIKIACPIISIVFWISYIYTQRSTLSTKKQI